MKLADFFSDNMVLQRDQSVPIWGWSTPGDNVTIEFAGQKKSAVAGSDGKWMVKLDPLPVSLEPRTLTAVSGQHSAISIHNILIGDVWLCSGQSNMQWPVESSANAEAEMAAADYPCIRLLKVPTVAKLGPQTDLGAKWQVCAPATVPSFSGAGYYFGREVWQATGIPQGLITCAWGGTRIEAWLSQAALLADPLLGPEVARIDAWLATPEGLAESTATPVDLEPWVPKPSTFDTEKWIHQQGRPDPGNRGFAAGWAALDCDDRQWPVLEIPQSWQVAGFNFSGVFWFRRAVEIPAEQAGQDLELHLGHCDKTDTTYFNGVQVGATGFETKNCWDVARVYPIPGKLVRAGRNVIATRVYSNFFHGGLTGPAEKLQLAGKKLSAIPLTGPWRYQVEHDFGFVEPTMLPGQKPGPGYWNTPHILFDSMLTPLVPAAIRGVLWDQGGSNAPQCRHYRQLFPLLIREWRRTFGQPDLPFYFVQFSNYGAVQQIPVQSGWAEIREAQAMGLREPHTGLVVTIDIGEANDIHPKNKQDVGKRLARHAFAKVYGRPMVCNGPLYRSHRVEGDAIRIEFVEADGLTTNDGTPVKGFVIAGHDKKYEWAEARIEGPTVVVRSPKVPAPVSVRYAWADNPPVNLYNAAGLPAAPFRTDID